VHSDRERRAPVVAAAPAKPKPGYTVEMAIETMDLCAIAKVPVSDAKAFVKAKTRIASVRSELARRAADATDALAVDGTAKPAGAAETAIAVVQDLNSKLPANARRRTSGVRSGR